VSGSAPSSITRLLGRSDGERLEPDASWTNSFGVVFGGVTVAALLDAWAGRLEPDHRLRSAHLAFARPLISGSVAIDVRTVQAGRTTSRLAGAVTLDGELVAEGFAVAARASGPSTPAPPLAGIAPADELGETVDRRGATAPFISHHFEIRVARRPSADDPFVHQWVRLRHLPPDGDGQLPVAALGLLADLVSVGVFRTAVRTLGGLWAVKSLDLSLHLTGATPSEWTLLSIATPPIHEGSAVAHAVLRAADGAPVATVDQQVLVQPLDAGGRSRPAQPSAEP
jgi:acyl-CoA thioesterase